MVLPNYDLFTARLGLFSEISAGNIASDVCGFFSHTHKKGIISRSKEREREREKEKKQRRPPAKRRSDRNKQNVRMTLVSPLSSNRGGMLPSTSTSTSSVLFRRRLVCSNSRSISRKLVPRRSNNSRTSSRKLSATTEEEASVRPSSSSSSRIQEAASADIGVVYKRFVKVRFVLEKKNIHSLLLY